MYTYLCTFYNGQSIIGFHTTTPEAAAAIVEHGPQANACRVGFDGREMPDAFWLNNVPWVPYSVEQFHPTFTPETDMAVLAMVFPFKRGPGSFRLESTWPFAQWALTQEVAAQAPILVLPPERFGRFRSAASMEQITGYIARSVEGELMPADGYASKLLTNNAREN